MPNNDLQQPVTVGDLLNFKRELMINQQSRDEKMMEAIRQETRSKKFYTIAEFHKTVGPAEAVLQKYCTIGKLKATQIVKGGTWIIDACEVDRMRKEAVENHFNKSKSTTSTDRAIIKKLEELGISLK